MAKSIYISITILYTISITVSITTIYKITVKDSGIVLINPLNNILMITTHLIQQIIDLSVRLTGDDLTPKEEQVLNDSSIEELQAIRETLLLALHF